MTTAEVHKIGYELYLHKMFRELSFRDFGKKNKNDLKTEIGRLSHETRISKDKILDFGKVFMSDLRDRAARKIQKDIDALEHISFKK